MNANSGFVAAAGLSGAAGVALSAVAAHAPAAHVGTAAQFLLFHAPVFLAAGLTEPPVWLRRAVTLILIGVALFVGDLLARDYLGDRLFAMAAPLGGSLTIIGWLLVAVVGVVRLRG